VSALYIKLYSPKGRTTQTKPKSSTHVPSSLRFLVDRVLKVGLDQNAFFYLQIKKNLNQSINHVWAGLGFRIGAWNITLV